MPRSFNDLAARAKAGWSDDAHAVYDAAGAAFDTDLAARVELGAMLAEARLAHHFTQPALSQATGIQQSEISRIERGLGNPTAATLTRLATALGQKVVLAPASC